MATEITLTNLSGTTTNTGFIQPGPTLVRSFPFTFGTAGLTAGVPILALSAGDILLDVGVSVSTAFNGTTPLADVGTFSSTTGLFHALGAVVDLTAARAAITSNTGLDVETFANWLSTGAIAKATAAESAIIPWQVTVTAACELLLVVSETGAKGGTATGATAGAGTVYVVTCSPS